MGKPVFYANQQRTWRQTRFSKQEPIRSTTPATMNKKIALLVSASILLLFSTVFCIDRFIRLDKNMYYYGINALDIYEPINGRITPVNGSLKYQGFGNPYRNCVELWEDDFALVAKGIVYNHYSDIVVDSLVAYGFNDNCVVAECVAKNKGNYYIILDSSSLITLIGKDSCANILPQSHFRLKSWFDSVNNPPQQMTLKHRHYKTCCIILMFLTLLFLAIAMICMIHRFFCKKIS